MLKFKITYNNSNAEDIEEFNQVMDHLKKNFKIINISKKCNCGDDGKYNNIYIDLETE